MTENLDRQTEKTRTVRPRWAWIALLVMVLGLVLIGWGIIAESWTWAVPGLVVLAAGGATALYGGLFYDVQGGSSLGNQVHDVVEGNEQQFPTAGTMRSEAEVKKDVRRRWLGRRG